MIVPIVEGPGDVEAVPIVLRRVLAERLQIEGVRVLSGMKLHRSKMTCELDMKRHLRLASMRSSDGLILVILDADDDDCVRLVSDIRKWANDEGLDHRVEVLVISREFESWLLAGIESLRGLRGLSDEATPPSQLENLRGCKERLSELMSGSRTYHETADQAAMSSRVSLDLIAERVGSFAKLEAKLRRRFIG
jgi:hypothetical protein